MADFDIGYHSRQTGAPVYSVIAALGSSATAHCLLAARWLQVAEDNLLRSALGFSPKEHVLCEFGYRGIDQHQHETEPDQCPVWILESK